MKIKGVITGDIIQSSRINLTNRQLLLDTIQYVAQEVRVLSDVRMEIFRGDSFQMIVNEPSEALKIAVLIRAGLQKETPDSEKKKWDMRVALGLGTVDFDKEHSIVESDGEAFHNSGWEFDELGKSARLAIRTPWEEVNEEFKVSTVFADEIISAWTIPQAKVIYLAILSGKNQKELAQDLDKTPQAISKLMKGGRARAIELYLERFTQQIATKI